MKRRTIALVILVSLIFIVLVVGILIFLKPAKRNVIYNVREGVYYSSVQEAINAAKEGDRLIVYPGRYRENIVVNKTLMLEGLDRDEIFIEPANRSVIALAVRAHNVTIANLTIGNAPFGIYLFYSNNSKVMGNKVLNCNLGIFLRHSNETLVKNNIILNANLTGIEIYHATNNTVIGNKISNCSGIYGGISIIYSSNNEVRLNLIANNTYGIHVYQSSQNKIFHNNFINNENQYFVSGSINKWDDGYPSGGNYWSDYKGKDENNDGIGDTSYFIDEENEDRYPLMNPITIP